MNDAKDEPQYFTARHLLQMLQGLDAALLDMPVIFIHGKDLDKPNLVAGFLPSAVPVDKEHVEEKKPSFLSLGHLTKFKRK
jgi:hypothetical protein